jgi:CheY-like chemotaxis protein
MRHGLCVISSNVRMNRPIASGPDCRSLAGKSVLIVEDDDDSRELLRVILESCDMDVSDSDTADAALVALDRTHFDLIISDIGMPGSDGYDLIRAVRCRPESSRIPAVAVTAFVRSEDRARALLAGFDMHIGKPLDSTALLQALVALLGSARRPG